MPKKHQKSAKKCQKAPESAKKRQKVPKSAKKCQKVPKSAKKCQIAPHLNNLYQKYQKSAQNQAQFGKVLGQVLSKLPKCFKILEKLQIT